MTRLVVTLLFAAAIAVLAADSSYEQQLLKWRADRLAELTADDGWLTVVGLFWMHPGKNRAGSGGGMDLKMAPPAPPELGTFALESERVSFRTAPGVAVRAAGRLVTADIPIEMDKTVLEHGPLRMMVIHRGKRVGLRVRDRDSAARRAFKGLEYFPIQESRRVRAHLEPFDPPRHIPIINVLGDETDLVSPGRLVFELDGVTYSLDALYETAEKKDLFIIFRDRTSGESTYPAGRYMHMPLPANGETEVDFNRAYNPPCAFTEFATCPLPPKQNWLKVRIEAGEKNAHAH
jgi:uncharacterized protein (DUF1684 family)